MVIRIVKGFKDDEICADWIQSLIEESQTQSTGSHSRNTSAVRTAIHQLSRPEQATLAIAILRWYCHDQQNSPASDSHRSIGSQDVSYVLDTLRQMLSRKLPFTESDILEFIAAYRSERQFWYQGFAPWMKVIQNYLHDYPLTAELQQAIKHLSDSLQYGPEDGYKDAVKLRALIAPQPDQLAILLGEAWSDEALNGLNALPEEQRLSWIQLIEACALVSGGKPATKWLKSVRPHREAIGGATLTAFLLQWFPLVDRPRTQPLSSWRNSNDVIADRNADILKGLVWLCADQTDAELVRAIGKLAISAYRKIPGIGPRCVKLGNACVWTLGQMPTSEAIAQLALLTVKVKFGTAQKGIDKALTAAAEREGLPREEIEELAVPTYGLTEVGLRRETLGEFTAELVITGTSSTALRWLKPDGKLQKSVPSSVKVDDADNLKALKQAAKDIQKMLPAQRDRIESLYLQQKSWDFVTWRDRYLNHPLIGTLARRILWQFETHDDAPEPRHALGIWFDNQLVDLEKQPLTWLHDQSQVSLWHPITATPETVQAWRNWLLTHEIQQPFKQAHRELYLLTAAEENTRLYSNRFAAHILKQHQFNALCGQRGWKNQLRLMVDDEYYPARLLLPQWGLRAEFWIEGIGDHYGIDTTEAGTYLYLATDQVRFYAVDASENSAYAGGGGYAPVHMAADPIPLADTPALVFTEVMRDVDLFVGVASVGNDPNWIDGGSDARRPHHDYWQAYSFGELSATAQTRRQVLETLVPKLKKICDRCSFQDRFLVVKGDRRTYKIHLGSSNILMEPNDQYLCIVSAGASAANNIFLPFEGDKTLTLILSKAFLLADDSQIKDPTILSQIGG